MRRSDCHDNEDYQVELNDSDDDDDDDDYDDDACKYR